MLQEDDEVCVNLYSGKEGRSYDLLRMAHLI